jgi:hypothetical protein
MALPVTIPNTFANATAAIPLSQLDANFNTLSNAVNGLNSGSETLANLKATTANVVTLTVTGNATIGDASTDTVTLNSTLTANTAVIFSAGTSAAPSITFTGDTNTGIFSPAADTIAFAEGGVEAMRIDSSGNVGIGTTSPSNKLDVYRATGLARLRNQTGDASQVDLQFENSGGSGYLGLLSTGENFYDARGAIAAHIFQISGAESMRINSSGNVGIGTSSPNGRLSVLSPSTAQAIAIWNRASDNTYGGVYFKTSDGATDQSNILNEKAGTNGAGLLFYTKADGGSSTERMRIDSSGNVGIGTTSPKSIGAGYQSLDVRGSTGGGFYFGPSGASNYSFLYASASATDFGTTAAAPLRFYTSDAERARINSSGNLRLGLTGDIDTNNPERFGVSYTYPQTGMAMKNGATDTTYAILFTNPNGIVGSIQTSASATSYVTSSDYRLKENIAPMTGALAKVALLKPVTYKWKVDGSDGEGFIAHELQEVAPYAVSGEKDGEEMQGVDYGKITPLLTAALQEAIAEIQSLKARVAELEAK